MENKEFSKHLVNELNIEKKEETLYISSGSPFPDQIDYTDFNQVKIVASNAIRTGDGFYRLIKENCDTSNLEVSSNARLEMYFALAGLACEIYMKGIIYFENKHNGKKYTGHKLSELMNHLPETYKAEIQNSINDIELSLPLVENAFTDLRYDFELTHIQGNYLLLFDLLDELKTIVDKYQKTKVTEIRYVNGTLGIE